MKWGITNRERSERSWEQRRYFAWHPVHLQDGRWCWLEWVWRFDAETDYGSNKYYADKQAGF